VGIGRVSVNQALGDDISTFMSSTSVFSLARTRIMGGAGLPESRSIESNLGSAHL